MAAHKLAVLDIIRKNAEDEFWETQEMERKFHEEGYSDRLLARLYKKKQIAECNYDLFKKQSQLIGAICIQQNLPGGKPPWMGQMIADYV